MGERATKLHDAADAQISELTGLLSTQDHAALRLPCPGREKLGDGTIGAVASHTADSYLRIAGFLRAAVQGATDHEHGRHGDYEANTPDRTTLLKRLRAASSALALVADLSDEQLESVPAASDMKFSDGTRTLEQILDNLLKHQGHQVQALHTSVA